MGKKIKGYVIHMDATNKQDALDLVSDMTYCVDNIMTEEEYERAMELTKNKNG